MHRFITWVEQPEWIFLIVAVLFGGVLCFYIPNQSGFDETTQLARAWEISGGYLIPNQKLSQGPYLPAAFLDISYRNQFFYDLVDPNYFDHYKTERIDWNVFVDYQTRSSYLPTLYLPQAVVLGLLGRILNVPVLLIFYTCRLLNLLGYILLTFFAIRLIPFGKWLLVVLAMAPIAVYQASTISQDAYTNGACFLFIAWVLKLACQEKRINWKQFWITIGITTLLLMVKINAAFLLPLLVLLVWKGFESKKMLPILIGAVVILFLGFVMGWNLLVYSTFYLNTPGYGAFGQLGYVLSHLLKFGATVSHDIFINGLSYLRDWVATYGFGAWQVSPITYFLFGLVLMAAWVFSPSPQSINLRTRLLLIFTSIFGCIFMLLVIYLTLNPIGSSVITDLQGRHFTPLLPILFLGLVPTRKFFLRLKDWVLPVLVGVGTVLTLGAYLLGIYLSYYVVCGNSIYSSSLCYQPQYKNWAPNDNSTQPLVQGVLLEQTFTAICSPLESVRVWSAPSPQELIGETVITIKDGGTGAVLAEDRVNNQTAPNHGWLEMTFPPVENAVGKDYAIEITSNITNPDAGLSFGETARREYLNGLHIDGNPTGNDLIFQYGCGPLTLSDIIHRENP